MSGPDDDGPRGISRVYVDVEERHWWYRGRRRILMRLLERFVRKPPVEIVDVGCGSGQLLRFLSAFGSARGIERDPELVRLGRELGRDVERRDFPGELPEGDFDVVTLFDVLEHLPDDRAGLAAACRLLRPGGLLFVSVPALGWLWSPHDVAVGHYRRYEAAGLSRRLREAGLRILHRTYFNALLLPLAAAHRLFLRRPGHDLDLPPRAINEILAVIFGAERGWAAGPGFGIGSSLAAVAFKPRV